LHPLLILVLTACLQDTYECTVPFSDKTEMRRMKDFDNTRQVYTKWDKLSFLPFSPPPFLVYMQCQLAGTFKVMVV
jgi:hypothetical protein